MVDVEDSVRTKKKRGNQQLWNPENISLVDEILNRGFHDGLNLAKQRLNSHPNSPKFCRCFVLKFTRSFEIPAGAFTIKFGAISGISVPPDLFRKGVFSLGEQFDPRGLNC